MALPQIVVCAVLAAVLLAFFVFTYLDSQDRKAYRERVAEELGFSFVDTNEDVMTKCSTMRTFGHRACFSDAMEGQVGNAKVIIGDCPFSTGGGAYGSVPTEFWTVCVVQNPSCHIPHCYLRPRNAIGDKLDALLFGHQVDFVDDPEFSKYFVAWGRHDLFDERIRVRCLEFRHRGIYIEAKDDILIYHYGKKCKPSIASQMMQEALEIHDLLSDSWRNWIISELPDDLVDAMEELAKSFRGVDWQPHMGWDTLRERLSECDPVKICEVIESEQTVERLLKVSDDEWDALIERVIDRVRNTLPDVQD